MPRRADGLLPIIVLAFVSLPGCRERSTAVAAATPTPIAPFDVQARDVPSQEFPPPCDLPPVDPAAPPDCARMGAFAVLRQTTHPAGATAVDLRLEDGCGRALPRSYGACLETGGASIAPREYDGASTLLLVEEPASSEAQAAQAAAVDAFLAARPPWERIAVHRAGAAPAQIADFTDDRARLATQLAGGLGPSGGTSDPPALDAELVAEAQRVVARVGGVAHLDRRAVVVLAPGRAPPPLHAGAVPVLWLDAAPPDLPAAARGAAEQLDVIDAAGAVALGTCAGTELIVDAPDGPLPRTAIPLIAPLPGTTDGACDAAAAAAGTRAPVRRVAFSFTATERVTYQSRLSAGSREDFSLSVRLGTDAAPVPAVAHLRGNGAFSCSRRSYAVDLEGNRPRHLFPGMASDEFLLISMCNDEAYTGLPTAMRLAERLGLLAYPSSLVELVLGGESRGVYLLIAKPKKQLRLLHAHPSALLRRGNDAQGKSPEVKHAEGDVDPMAAYDALLREAETRSGADLLAALERRIDLDQFLRWVALNSLLRNGDSVDEIYFLGTESRTAPGGAFFSIGAWDLDDLYSSCHNGGLDAMPDPRGLTWCVEGRLERRILGDPAGYARYVQVLADLLARLTPADFQAGIDQTAAELLPFFADPAIRAASEEIGRPDTREEATRKIRDELDRLSREFNLRRTELLDRIDDHGPAPP